MREREIYFLEREEGETWLALLNKIIGGVMSLTIMKMVTLCLFPFAQVALDFSLCTSSWRLMVIGLDWYLSLWPPARTPVVIYIIYPYHFLPTIADFIIVLQDY